MRVAIPLGHYYWNENDADFLPEMELSKAGSLQWALG